MIGIVGSVCLGAGIGLGIVPLISTGLLVVAVSIGLLLTTTVNSVRPTFTSQSNIIHATV